MEITNEATGTYMFSGSSEQNTVNSNVNQIDLLNATGLNIVKIAGSSTFTVGEIIEYTVNITNSSNHFLNGVRIIDNLGGGNLAYVVGSATLTIGNLTYSVSPVATNPLTFTLQQLNVGESMTLRYKMQVIFNLPSSITSITNTVQGIGYTSTGTVVGFDSETITRAGQSEVSLVKSSSVDKVFPRQPISYYLTLSNNTSIDATAISIVDQLPTNFFVTGISLKIGNGAIIELQFTDFTLTSNNLLTIPSVSGPVITVPAGLKTVITINGYFI